jgi:hypothetical protein
MTYRIFLPVRPSIQVNGAGLAAWLTNGIISEPALRPRTKTASRAATSGWDRVTTLTLSLP